MHLSRHKGVTLSIVFVCFVASAGLAAGPGRAGGRTDLRVRVVAPYREFTRAFWNVTVTAPSGAPVQEVAETGNWVVFPKLAAASYSVCITGVRERRRCTTVEVTPPVAGSRARHDIELEAPRSNISLADLRRPNRPEAGTLTAADRGTGFEVEGAEPQNENGITGASATPSKPLQPTHIR
jgi:hypothetical protein